MARKARLGLSVAGDLVPGNAAKLAMMTMVWGLTFRRILPSEFAITAGVNLAFVGINAAALARGIFRFDHPDLFEMPVWEYLMWGFYTLHTTRMLRGKPSHNDWRVAFAAAGVFASPFATIADPALLLLVATMTLAGCFVLFHEWMDWVYAGYMLAVGTLIEHVGVWTGQWHYPHQPYGGVPLWFVPMWAGVGLFVRRLILPVLDRPAGRNGTSRQVI
jgi:hypothetical protein